MDNNERLAELLFPHIVKTPEEYEAMFPERNLGEGARVTRFAPSPTGFLHIGGLFAALCGKLTASSTGGVFFLRIEDTDKKREITDGVSEIIKGLDAFGVMPDEGVIGFEKEKGDYGPYTQSKRKDIYQCFAKELVKKGLAYPCFCSEEDLNDLREKQENLNLDNKGYYGEYAVCRNLSYEEIEKNLNEGKTYVLRLRSPGSAERRITFEDMIKGKIEMPENIQDVVLLKTDGIPTYHFAHAVDDHLMRSTHIVRGDEWISSVPLHIQLFKCCGFKVPKYAHISPIMKEENGGKRKLSKRKDPEAAVTYYFTEGYPKESVVEYLLTIANSNFEDWRKANPDKDNKEFPFNLKKMSSSGALFDLTKLTDVSKNVISVMTAEEVFEKTLAWAKENDTELYKVFADNPEYAENILSIDRGGNKPRKDIAAWSEIRDYVEYFYDEFYKPNYEMPENISKEDVKNILEEYKKVFNIDDSKDEWFGRIKDLCPVVGFTPNVKEYKKTPELFKGHVGDVSSVIRIAVTSRKNTPDLYSIMALLGKDKVTERIDDCLSSL